MAEHLRDEQKPQEWIFALRYNTICVIASETRCYVNEWTDHVHVYIENFPGFIEFIAQNLEHLPEVVHKWVAYNTVLFYELQHNWLRHKNSSLIQTIVGISSGTSDTQLRDKYLGLIFSMVEVRG
jgi:hypothetical protein